LVINEGQLSLNEMQIDRSPFPVNKLDLVNPAVLVWPEQGDTTKVKNKVIGDPRPEEDIKSTPSCKVVMEKLPNGEETITITIRVATRGKPKDQLRLTTIESGSQPLLTRSRRSDRHLIGQTATTDLNRRHRAMARPPHLRTNLREWSSR
jgi:hypothetical protein